MKIVANVFAVFENNLRKEMKKMYDDSFKVRYKTAPVAVSENINMGNTPPHIHGEIEILVIERGCASVRIGNSNFMAKAGDMIFVNPFEIHEIKIDGNNDYRHKCICFDSLFIAEEQLRNLILKGYVKFPELYEKEGEVSDDLIEIFSDLYVAAQKGGKALWFECFAYVSKLFAVMINNNIIVRCASFDDDKIFCRNVFEYFEENYSHDISSKDAAKQLGYNQSYFCRIFKKNFGVCFSEYLNIYRISAAKKLLESKDKKICDIAFECGFLSPTYFSRCFKKYIGMLPSEYRDCQYES